MTNKDVDRLGVRLNTFGLNTAHVTIFFYLDSLVLFLVLAGDRMSWPLPMLLAPVMAGVAAAFAGSIDSLIHRDIVSLAKLEDQSGGAKLTLWQRAPVGVAHAYMVIFVIALVAYAEYWDYNFLVQVAGKDWALTYVIGTIIYMLGSAIVWVMAAIH